MKSGSSKVVGISIIGMIIFIVIVEMFKLPEVLKLAPVIYLFFILPLSLLDQKAKSLTSAIIKNLMITIFVYAAAVIALGLNVVAIMTFVLVMIGMAGLIPSVIRLSDARSRVNQSINAKAENVTIRKCNSCNNTVSSAAKYCNNCGALLVNNVHFEAENLITPAIFDPMYSLEDDDCLEQFILKEVDKAGIDLKTKLIAEDALKRKRILMIILSVLIFVLISLVFFHFPIYTYLIGLVLLIIIIVNTNKFSYLKYLKKKVKERPGEKISNIVVLSKETLVKDTSKKFALIGIIIAIVLSLGIFSKPRIIYEKMDDGYGVRFYAFGWTNFKTVNIPDEHKGKPVISLRGNAFSNMPFLEKVELSDNIVEIRGQAFKNCLKLKEVKLPKKLKTIGGSSFANCKKLEKVEFGDEVETIGGRIFENATSLKEIKLPSSLKEIGGGAFRNCTALESIEFPDSVTIMGGSIFEGATNLKSVKLSNNLVEIGGGAFKDCTSLIEISIPDSVTSLGGEAFMNATNLTTVKLSENLTEIRGDTFNNCASLAAIAIPDKVTRIGGHAFEGDYRLQSVTFGEKSQLNEIGSSAFRSCSSLQIIYLPENVSINERAFKNSPTAVKYFHRVR